MWGWYNSSWLLDWRIVYSSYILKYGSDNLIIFYCYTYLSGAVHTRVEVHRMDLEMSGLVEQPWLQLMCCAVCLLHGHNFRWWEEIWDGNECWLVSRSLMVDFIFIFSFHFILFFFYFLFLEQLGLGFISHTVTSWWQSHKTDYKTWENRVEGSGIKWHHNSIDNTCWPHVIHMVI